MPLTDSALLFKSLLKTLSEQAGALGFRLSNEQITNLTYSFKKIEPKDIEELAFTIGLGVQQKATHEIADRYIQRRKYKVKVFIPYNKIRDLGDILFKTRGILFYREQVDTLLTEIIGRYSDLPCTLFVDRTTLARHMTKEYKRRLSKQDIETIHQALVIYTKVGMASYKWCLEMAENVLNESTK